MEKKCLGTLIRFRSREAVSRPATKFMNKRSWTDQDLIKQLPHSSSYKDLCENLDIRPMTTSYRAVKEVIGRLNLSTTHFKALLFARRQAAQKHRSPDPNKWLQLNTKISTWRLKRILIKNELIRDICSKCNQKPSWNGESLTLQLDHINGVHNDNRLENLRLLCPNCHSQTSNFAGRNKGKGTK